MDTTARTWLKTGAIGLAGLAAGGILATTVSATAENSSSGDTTAQDGTGGRPTGEKTLTGDTADKVREAALAKYPGATVERLETDSEGVYEAHLVTADGTLFTVQVGWVTRSRRSSGRDAITKQRADPSPVRSPSRDGTPGRGSSP